jgi:MinD-like ATPase involved in chromosome partitioning or flagellar assembly
MEKEMTQIISVHSFRGGTGKSNTTANLATLLAMRGKRVGIVDTDIQSPGIHVLFNLDESDMTHSLNDYLWGKCDIQDAAKDVTDRVGVDVKGKIYLIPASMKAGEIARVLREGYDVGLLNDGFRSVNKSLNLDFLMIDTHPGLNEETLLSVAISSALVVIMRPDNQDYLGTAVTIDVARKLDVPKILLVVNKIPQSYDLDDVRQKVEKLYECQVAALLPHSDDMMALASSGIFSVQYPDHAVSQGLMSVVDQILA